MSFNKKINNVLKLTTAYSQFVFNYVKFAQEDNSLLNSMISLNAAIKALAAVVKLTDPNEPDMKSLVRSGDVLIDDFQNTTLPPEHFMKRLHRMRNALDTVKAMNYFIEEQNVYEGTVSKTPNTKLFEKANIVSERLSQVEAGLKTYKGKSGPVVPRKTVAPVKPPVSKPVQVPSGGQAYMPMSEELEAEKVRILSEVDAGEYNLDEAATKNQNKDSLSGKAIQELLEEQKQFGFNPEGASQEELDEVVDKLLQEKWGR